MSNVHPVWKLLAFGWGVALAFFAAAMCDRPAFASTVRPVEVVELSPIDEHILRVICRATKESGDPHFLFDHATGDCAPGTEYEPNGHITENAHDRSIWLPYLRNPLCLGADRVLVVLRENRHTGELFFRYTKPEPIEQECPFTDFVAIVPVEAPPIPACSGLEIVGPYGPFCVENGRVILRP